MKHVDFIGNSWSGSIRSVHINRQVAIKFQDLGFKRRECVHSQLFALPRLRSKAVVFSLFILQSNTYHDKETAENSHRDPDVTKSLTLQLNLNILPTIPWVWVGNF